MFLDRQTERCMMDSHMDKRVYKFSNLLRQHCTCIYNGGTASVHVQPNFLSLATRQRRKVASLHISKGAFLTKHLIQFSGWGSWLLHVVIRGEFTRHLLLPGRPSQIKKEEIKHIL